MVVFPWSVGGYHGAVGDGGQISSGLADTVFGIGLPRSALLRSR
jgi:hypothetical protein